MNERYLYRGKRLDNGEWVTGWIVHDDLIRDINGGCGLSTVDLSTDGRFECDVVRIDPVTRGQCTGLRDKNGVLIYEGDIVKLNEKGNRLWEIKYRDGSYILQSIKTDNFLATGKISVCAGYMNLSYYRPFRQIEIIGNIHKEL